MQSERLKYQKDYTESIKKLEEQWMINQQKQGDHGTEVEPRDDCLDKTCSREVYTIFP